MELEWLLFFFFAYVSCLSSSDSIVIWASDFMPSLCHSLFTKTILHGETENPPSCNQSCCLFSCQTWGPWALRSISLLEALLSLPKCFLSFAEHHAHHGLVYSALLALFRQISLNEAERKLSGGPVTRCWIRWISLLSYLLILGGCSLLCCGLLRARVYFLEGDRFKYSISVHVKTLWQLLPTLKLKPHRTRKSHEPWHRSVRCWRPIFSSVQGVSIPLT